MEDYPAPEFSMLPITKGYAYQGNRPTPANVTVSLFTASARNGLGVIASALLSAGSKVLIPAYHCPALVEPFIWAQCDVVFYPLNNDLSPDLKFLEDKLSESDAILLVPFFGFSQDIAQYSALAKKNNCLVIEDLAHAAHKNTLHGDYGVTSLQKFYPVSSGGELFVSKSNENDIVQRLWEKEKRGVVYWGARNLLGKVRSRVQVASKATARGFIYFDPSRLGEPMSGRDLSEVCMHNHEDLAQKRRGNYEKLDAYLNHCPLGKPLFPGLGSGDSPYVYPFLLKEKNYFDMIRNLAIPLYRWEEICPSGCETTGTYRTLLVQFPCHQDLTDSDIKTLISKLKTIPA